MPVRFLKTRNMYVATALLCPVVEFSLVLESNRSVASFFLSVQLSSYVRVSGLVFMGEGLNTELSGNPKKSLRLILTSS